MIVPGKTLQEISKILSGEMDDMIRLSFARNHLVFEMEGTTVVSRLIEGEYFSIDQMISTDYETKLVVNKREFLSCIDRATLFVRETKSRSFSISGTTSLRCPSTPRWAP